MSCPATHPATLNWRQRMGEVGAEWLLAQSVTAATRAGALKRPSLAAVIVDTTVQPRAIANPTDSRLPYLACEHRRVSLPEEWTVEDSQ